jgi:hypothetical protein
LLQAAGHVDAALGQAGGRPPVEVADLQVEVLFLGDLGGRQQGTDRGRVQAGGLVDLDPDRPRRIARSGIDRPRSWANRG